MAPSKPRFTSILRPLVKPTTSALLAPSSGLLSLSLPPTIDCLPCLLHPGQIVFSDDDREYFAISLDCRRTLAFGLRCHEDSPEGNFFVSS